MTNTQRFTVALLSVFSYGRGISPQSDADGHQFVSEFEAIRVFVPRGEVPTVRPITDEEREGFTELVAQKEVAFMPEVCVEFERAFLFGGTDDQPGMEPMMFGTGFGFYAPGDGQYESVTDVDDIAYNLASMLLGQGGDEYAGLASGEAELSLKQARFNFAQTMEAVQNVMRHKTRKFMANQHRDLLAFGVKLAQELSERHVAKVYDMAWLFADEPQPQAALPAPDTEVRTDA